MSVLKRTFKVIPGVSQKIQHGLQTDMLVTEVRTITGNTLSGAVLAVTPEYVEVLVDPNVREFDYLDLYIAY